MTTILVADDDRDVVDVEATLLEAANYRVLRAYSVREALDLLDEHDDIALLLADIRMPEFDGFDLLRVVRHRFPSMPVVLMTGFAVTDDDVIPSGATILQKPVTGAELTRVIGERVNASA